MKRMHSISMICLIQAALLMPALLAVGCGAHPDDKDAVYSAFNKSNLRSVDVHQDRHSGVLTLTGIVNDANLKSQAETIARQEAPGYIIADQIQVRPAGA